MAIRLTKIKVRNFRSIGKCSLSLPSDGLLAVVGSTKAFGFVSNGAGKSSLLNAVPWAIWGKLLEPSRDADSIIRNGTDTASVELSLAVDTPAGVEVVNVRRERTRGGAAKLEVSIGNQDVTGGIKKITARQLEMMVGSFEKFTTASAFAATRDGCVFGRMKDSEKKQALSHLVDLSRYKDAQAVAKLAVKEKQEQIEKLTAKAESLTERIEQLNERDFDKLRSELIENQEVARRQYRAAEKEIETLEDEVKGYRRKLKEWEVQSQLVGEEYDAVMESLREAKANLATLSRLLDPKNTKCPTCGQTTKSVTPQDRLKMEQDVRAAQNKLTASEMDAEVRKARVLEVAKLRPDNQSVRLMDKALKSRQEAEQSMTSTENALKTWQAEQDAHEELIEATTAKLEKCETDTASLSEAIEPDLFWAEHFGGRKLCSYLVDGVLSQISATATQFAVAVFGDGASIDLSPTREKQDGEESQVIDLRVTIPNFANDYEDLSRGQKSRVDACIVLAFAMQESTDSRAWGLLLIDELFDGMDEAGVATVLSALASVASDRLVMVATNSVPVAEAVDAVIVCQFDGEKTSISVKG